MKWFLFVLAGLMLLISFGTVASAKTTIHEIQAYLFGLMAAVLFIGAAIVDAVNKLGDTMLAAAPVRAAPEAPPGPTGDDALPLAPLASQPRKNL